MSPTIEQQPVVQQQQEPVQPAYVNPAPAPAPESPPPEPEPPRIPPPHLSQVLPKGVERPNASLPVHITVLSALSLAFLYLHTAVHGRALWRSGTLYIPPQLFIREDGRTFTYIFNIGCTPWRQMAERACEEWKRTPSLLDEFACDNLCQVGERLPPSKQYVKTTTTSTGKNYYDTPTGELQSMKFLHAYEQERGRKWRKCVQEQEYLLLDSDPNVTEVFLLLLLPFSSVISGKREDLLLNLQYSNDAERENFLRQNTAGAENAIRNLGDVGAASQAVVGESPSQGKKEYDSEGKERTTTKADLLVLKKLFYENLDFNNDGKLSKGEFRFIVHPLALTDDEFFMVFFKFDVGKQGEIVLDEMLYVVASSFVVLKDHSKSCGYQLILDIAKEEVQHARMNDGFHAEDKEAFFAHMGIEVDKAVTRDGHKQGLCSYTRICWVIQRADNGTRITYHVSAALE